MSHTLRLDPSLLHDPDYGSALLVMESDDDRCDLSVHRITGTTRVVSASVGDLCVLYRTVVDDAGFQDIQRQVDAYNADPAAGWTQLQSALAAGSLDEFTALLPAAPPSPYRLLNILQPDQAGAAIAAAAPAVLAHAESPAGWFTVDMPIPDGDTLALYLGPADPAAEVELFNQDPQHALRQLFAAAIAARIQWRRDQLAALAALTRDDMVRLRALTA